MRAITSPALTCLLAITACGTASRPREADSAEAKMSSTAPAAAAPSTPAISSPAGNPADGCRKWGVWQLCNVEDRLTRAGLVLERDDKPVRHAFLSVPGVRYNVYKAQVQVFVYPTAAERARDTDALDTLTVAPRGQQIIWPEPATLVTSANLAAIILSVNARQSERIALALGAGLPQHPP